MVETNLRQRQSKTATKPPLLIRIHKSNNVHTLDKIDAILCNKNIHYYYSHKSGYLPNSEFLFSLQQFYKMDSYAGLSLNQYLQGLYGPH